MLKPELEEQGCEIHSTRTLQGLLRNSIGMYSTRVDGFGFFA